MTISNHQNIHSVLAKLTNRVILRALFVMAFFVTSWGVVGIAMPTSANDTPLLTGAEQPHLYLPLIKNKRVGLVVNQTSIITKGQIPNQHLVDELLKNQVQVVRLFAPEHGIRGTLSAGETFNSSVDPVTGLPIVSIYGRSKRPNREVIEDLDVLIFDIQDVGARFYTYINSLFYMMQAAQQANIEFVVLDRPNPHISTVSGPMLDAKFRSFVGLLPIPMVHGMTVGEIAKMAVGEDWLNSIDPLLIEGSTPQSSDKSKLKLTVIPVRNYTRSTEYTLPVAPSPNLPNQQAIRLYPSLCLFEATPISIGRGTDFPFQVIGHHQAHSGDFEFTPEVKPLAAKNPKLKGIKLTGQDLRSTEIEHLNLSYLLDWYKQFERYNLSVENLEQKDTLTFFSRADFFDKLAGTDQLRKQIEKGMSEQEIKVSWQPALDVFERQRQPYLLYP
nr:DUF1343 domain-containing protein [Psychrosphaera ytuae]